MPIISTIGAASSRGFGEFNQSSQPAYVEDMFSTYIYTGNAATQTISNNIAFLTTSAWSSYQLAQTTIYNLKVTSDSSNNFYVISYNNIGVEAMTITKYDPNGVVQWKQNLYEASGSMSSNDIAVDTSGNVYVTGQGYLGSAYAMVAKYNSSGVLQWQRAFGTSSSGNFISTDSSGNVYVVGRYLNTSDRLFVAKYNSSGVVQWTRELYPSGYSSYGLGGFVDSSGNVYATGYFAEGGGAIGIIAKYDSSGAIQWQRRLSENSTVLYRLAVDSSGNVYACGYATSSSIQYMIVAKYNSSGVLQWQRKFYETGIDVNGSDICVDPSGNVYVTGYLVGSQSILAKYNSSGTLQWQRSFNTTLSYLYGINYTAAGNLLVTGSYRPVSTYYGVTSKLKSDGSATSGTAIWTMATSTFSEAAAGASDAVGGLTDAAGSTSDGAASATDGSSTATASSATQAATVSSGGMVWIKARNDVDNHYLFDTARGPLVGINSNATTENTTTANSLTSFLPNGFSIGSSSTVNTNTANYVSWTFKEQSKFFDIVTYTGNGSARTISHSLGSVPGMILVKRTGTAANWAVYHRSAGSTKYLILNTTAASATDSTWWNDTDPTATGFTVGTSSAVNANGETYVAYLFAHVPTADGTIQCGSFTTSGGTDEISLGWEAQYVLLKRSDGVGDWIMLDTVRGFPTSNVDAYVYANSSAAETTAEYGNPTATGFAITAGFSAGQNWIYMAIRRGPMRIPTDATTVFSPQAWAGNGTAGRAITTGFLIDLTIEQLRSANTMQENLWFDRMRGYTTTATGDSYYIRSQSTAVESPVAGYNYVSIMNGFKLGSTTTALSQYNGTDVTAVSWNFQRAPGFFDIVCYTGNATARTIAHNLGAIPEMMIIKPRSNGGTALRGFNTYVAPLGNGNTLSIQTTDNSQVSSNWNYTSPTSSVFSVDNSYPVNESGTTYVAYLFASCPGVSKIGSYTGTGTTKQIDCGFTNGARFVLIKRTDTTGAWYVWDTARGIVAGDDPYLLLNSSAAEVTNTDYIDTYSAGFEITSTAPVAINANGGSYIFLAIA